MVSLQSELNQANSTIRELNLDLRSLQRIQHDQSKALEKLSQENEYVSKIRQLVEELKGAKERVKDME